jgi:hypothetical protein
VSGLAGHGGSRISPPNIVFFASPQMRFRLGLSTMRGAVGNQVRRHGEATS